MFAIYKMKNKTLGCDGLLAEFYVTFWNILGPIVLDVLNEAIQFQFTGV